MTTSEDGSRRAYRMLAFPEQDQSAFENVARLVKKLPKNIGAQFDTESVYKEYKSAWELVEVKLAPCRNQPIDTPTQPEISHAADEVFGAFASADDLSKRVIDAADRERDRAEVSSDGGSTLYSCLFAIGWIGSIAGILIGEDAEEKSIVEEIAEG